MIISDQIRAARAFLRWSAEDLARAAVVGYSTVRRMEAAEGVPSASGKNLEAVQRALEAQGIEFTNDDDGPGIKLIPVRQVVPGADRVSPSAEIEAVIASLSSDS